MRYGERYPGSGTADPWRPLDEEIGVPYEGRGLR